MLRDLNTEFMDKWSVKQKEHRKIEEENRIKLGYAPE